jgi:chorismate synthase
MSLRFLTAGESHGPALIALLEGMPAGLPVSLEAVQGDMKRRQQGYGAGPRMKIEQDHVQILGGALNLGEGLVSTGAPIAFQIENSDHEKWRGVSVAAMTTPRPGHADLTGALKYGYRDLRPALERASARETAARVAVGSICRQFLAQFSIQVGGYVAAIGEVSADLDHIPLAERIEKALENDVACPDAATAERMHARIRQAITERDTLGGLIDVYALGLPPGLGSFAEWDRRLEARLGAAILSVQAIKGVEIGPAFENARLPGTQAHDAISLDGIDLVRKTNRAGGLEGGITNGQPLHIRAAMKPIATTLTPQHTVDLAKGVETPTQYERSDFCPVPRAVVILEAMVAFVLADALIEKLGGDSLQEMRPRFDGLRRARLPDLPMDGEEHIFWL